MEGFKEILVKQIILFFFYIYKQVKEFGIVFWKQTNFLGHTYFYFNLEKPFLLCSHKILYSS